MAHGLTVGLTLAVALVLGVGAVAAEPEHEHGGGSPQAAAHRAETYRGPHGYERVTEPQGWNARPRTIERTTYQHDYQAARTYRIGPYHGPAGWTPHRWAYGQMLPRTYWTPQYILSDYWLFGLEVPPVEYEWVRVGADAILVNTVTGEILQIEYGVFA